MGLLLVISVTLCVVCCCYHYHYKKRLSTKSSTDPDKVEPSTFVSGVSTTPSAPPIQNNVTVYPLQTYPTAPQQQNQHYSAPQSAPQHDYATIQGSNSPAQGYSAQTHQPSAPYPIMQPQPPPLPYRAMQQLPQGADVLYISSLPTV